MKEIRSTKVLISAVMLFAADPPAVGTGYHFDSLIRPASFLEDRFVESYESLFREELNDDQHEGFLRLIAFLKADEEVTDLRTAAYMLATVRHETASTWQPVREFGLGEGRRYGNPDPELGKTYYGRGYVQLTWKENYERAGRYLGRDFVRNPDKTLEPEAAYLILSRGMREGWFTGRSLDDYISETRTDYVNARRVVNGTDRAERIASEAKKFEILLRRESALRERFAAAAPLVN